MSHRQRSRPSARGVRRPGTVPGDAGLSHAICHSVSRPGVPAEELLLLAGRYGSMFTTLFKRIAATVAAFVAIGAAGAMSLPGATAATTHQAASQSAHVAQSHQQPAPFCSSSRRNCLSPRPPLCVDRFRFGCHPAPRPPLCVDRFRFGCHPAPRPPLCVDRFRFGCHPAPRPPLCVDRFRFGCHPAPRPPLCVDRFRFGCHPAPRPPLCVDRFRFGCHPAPRPPLCVDRSRFRCPLPPPPPPCRFASFRCPRPV